MGKIYMKEGFSYLWVAEKRPVFWLPDGRVAVITVKRGCPYLSNETLLLAPGYDRVFELCGIRVNPAG